VSNLLTFPSRGSLTWGLSTKETPYPELIPVFLWLYNPTDESDSVSTCGIDQFWLSGIDVFDSSGHRVLSREEKGEKKARDSGRTTMMVYSANIAIVIPPHTCMHNSFPNPAYDSRDRGRGALPINLPKIPSF
jgi:hypothetical protein